MRVLIAIMTCAKYADRRAAIRSTWLPFVPSGVDTLFADGVTLDCPDTYDALPQKTLATVRYAVERDYDLLIKVDDDTFLWPRSDYLAEFSKHDCLCCVRLATYPQGGCYSLSRRAMAAVLAHPELFTVGPEDVAVGKALSLEGVGLAHTERIKSTVVFGHPTPWNNTIAGHCCQPREMRRIFLLYEW